MISLKEKDRQAGPTTARKWLLGLDLARDGQSTCVVSYFVPQSLKFYLNCVPNLLSGIDL